MNRRTLAFGSLLIVGCAGAADGQGADNPPKVIDEPAQQPGTSPTRGAVPPGREFSGAYDVPVPPELAAAATYATAHIHWTTQDGAARLEYDLPQGLVGGVVHVEFAGAFDPQANKATLTGAAGSAECTVSATSVSCLEHMPGILPLQPDMAMVEAFSRQDYAGPVQHRVEVTRRFIGDPIGIVRFELDTGVAAPPDDDAKQKRKRGDG